jgi:PAS domain S-box-containing protein
MSNVPPAKILVVDDEADVLRPVCDFLSESGYEVTGYSSSAEALNALEERTFDLLLTDLIMPEPDGMTLLKNAFRTDPNIVVVVITGYGSVQSAVEAMKEGAFDYITKPLDWKLFQPVLSRAIETGRLKKSEERYRAIVEDQTELIFRFLPDGTVRFVNEVFCRYFGRSGVELVGSNLKILLPGEDYENFKKHIASLDKHNPVATMEHRVIIPQGGVCWQRWTSRGIFDERERLVEIQSVGHDITESKLLEEDLRISRDRLRSLAARITEVEEKERHRIARELHDQVGQNLTALGININMLRPLLADKLTAEAEARLGDSIKILEETARSIRDVMADLRPSVLDDYGLMAAIRWYADQFAKRTGLHITVAGEEPGPRLPTEVELTLFRIVQEILTNTAKHAMASNIFISLSKIEGKIRLEIADDGVGFDTVAFSEPDGKRGWGILNMRERTDAIGGKLTITSDIGKGTRIIIETGSS